MKKTHKDLLDWLGLKVGDVIRLNNFPNKWIVANEEYITLDPKIDRYIEGGFKIVDQLPIEHLIEMEFNILPKPERVGDLICDTQIKCNKCPLKILCDSDYIDIMYVDTLYNILELFKKNENFDQEIYNFFKARLDKEVQDNDK